MILYSNVPFPVVAFTIIEPFVPPHVDGSVFDIQLIFVTSFTTVITSLTGAASHALLEPFTVYVPAFVAVTAAVVAVEALLHV